MFSEAYKKARGFTQPVIISIRRFDNSVECGCGAFIIINEEGWIITVAHLYDSFFEMQNNHKDLEIYKAHIKEINENTSLDNKHKKKKIDKLNFNSKWVTNHSFWWGQNNVVLKDIHHLSEADLVIGRLEPYNSAFIKTYPIFKNPSNLEVGKSLCKLGYPFHDIKATFIESNNSFKLADNALPLPLFPIEGLYTRNIFAGKTKDGKYDILFLETSSPGLRGQSGGPIFDINGTVWAVQSRTTHLSLGFSPQIVKNGKTVEENQFLNVGWGVHPSLIFAFLSDNKIKFNVSEY